MKTSSRFFACALLSVAALCGPTLCLAQSPFDGTWRIDMSKTKFSPKPYTFYVSQGWYHCESCSPVITIPADGQDHAVSGQSYDTLSVNASDPHSITSITKKDGKVVSEQTRTVSANGKTLTIKSTSHPMNSDKPITSQVTAKLVGIAPAGVHVTSGSWQILNLAASENDLLFTYKTAGDEITMTEPTGETYTAKFDGADYPVKGAYGYDAVSLKRINDHSIEETDKRGGKVTDVAISTVSADGKSLTVVDNDKVTDRTSTFVAKKQ
jgi:hypothetical protein